MLIQPSDKSNLSHHRVAAAFTSMHYHMLDHLAPLSYALDIPLILTEPSMYTLTQKFYPFIKAFCIEERHFSLEFIASEFDVLLISCKHWAKELSLFLKELYQRSPRFVYCPHGNSDKGYLDPTFDLLKDQDLSFVYGEQMMDLLKRKNILETLKGTVFTGNYRKKFYEEHQSFYDSLIETTAFSKFKKKQWTLLYAPTWKDPEDSSSFFDLGQKILHQLPKNINLLIKLHPNLEALHPEKVYPILGNYEHLENIHILSKCPLVYPILNRVDAYLGDFSSIGYDFLNFDKPMFFLNPKQRDPEGDLGLYLHRCGMEIPLCSYNNIFTFIQKNLTAQNTLSNQRKETYTYAFGEERSFDKIKQDLLKILLSTSSL